MLTWLLNLAHQPLRGGAHRVSRLSITMIKSTLIQVGDYIVPRSELLFCLCEKCLNEINWRHVDASYEINGHCCGLVIRGRPMNRHCSMYRLEVKPVDMRNVKLFPRKRNME